MGDFRKSRPFKMGELQHMKISKKHGLDFSFKILKSLRENR